MLPPKLQKYIFGLSTMCFPDGASGTEHSYQCRGHERRCKRHGFDPWVRKIPWIHSSILAGESHGQRSLAGPQGRKELDTTEAT